jgi:rhodanese-related sulfurtransferase
LIDHAGAHQLGELDEQLHAVRRARVTVDDDHRIVGGDEHPRRLFDSGRITGGRLIELGSLSAEAHTIDRDTPVVFYCRSGARSGMATQAFAQAGYDAHNMRGGLLAWDAAGLPLEPEGGYVDEA